MALPHLCPSFLSLLHYSSPPSAPRSAPEEQPVLGQNPRGGGQKSGTSSPDPGTAPKPEKKCREKAGKTASPPQAQPRMFRLTSHPRPWRRSPARDYRDALRPRLPGRGRSVTSAAGLPSRVTTPDLNNQTFGAPFADTALNRYGVSSRGQNEGGEGTREGEG